MGVAAVKLGAANNIGGDTDDYAARGNVYTTMLVALTYTGQESNQKKKGKKIFYDSIFELREKVFNLMIQP